MIPNGWSVLLPSKLLVITGSLGVLWAGGAPAQSFTGVSPLVKRTNLASVSQPSDIYSEMIVLTVDKTRLRAELRTWPSDISNSRSLKSFRIAVGKEEGDKQVEGDNKTPEGIYFAQKHIPGSALPEKYGTMAIPIDFPNPIDRSRGKTGHGIWLHGVDNAGRIEEAKVTEGCVAFYNPDIAKLGLWLKSHQGVVVIAKDGSLVNRDHEVQRIKALTKEWMAAWSERRIEDFIAHYADDFRHGYRDLARYKIYKKRIFDSYKRMTVTFNSLRIVTHPKYAISFFNQDFNGDDRYISNGRKILYWERDDHGTWRIKREVFEDRRFEYLTYTDAELALLSSPSAPGPTEKNTESSNL